MSQSVEDHKAFIKAMLPYSFTKEIIKEAEETVAGIIQLLSLSTSSKVLDAYCCGGTVTLALAKKGFKTASGDEIEESIQLGKQKAAEEQVEVSWIASNPLSEPQPANYDSIFHLGYSFGTVQSISDKQLLANAYKKLQHGGKIILQIIGRDVLEKYFTPKFWVEQHDGSFLLNERTINYETGVLIENYTFIKDGITRKFSYERKLYYPDEIQSLLESQGFKEVKIWGDSSGKEYNEQAQYMLISAEKVSHANPHFIRC